MFVRMAGLAVGLAVLAGIATGTANAAETAQAATTADLNPPGETVVLTKIHVPWYAPRFYVVGQFHKLVPQYDALPGLMYKYFTISDDGQAGGLYLWRSGVAAHGWFNDAWHARVLAQRGHAAEVRYYDAPVVLTPEPGAVLGSDEKAVASIATWPLAAGTTREGTIAAFRKSLEADRAVAGLLRRYYVLTAEGQQGEITLWASRSAAESAYGAAWKESVRARMGGEGHVEFLDAPVITPSRLPENQPIAAHP